MVILTASSLRNESWYPDTLIAIGSPNGAMRATDISVPGKQPISINFTARVSSVKPNMVPFWLIFRSDSVLKRFLI